MANSKVEIKKIVAEFLKSNLITTPVDDLLNFLSTQLIRKLDFADISQYEMTRLLGSKGLAFITYTIKHDTITFENERVQHIICENLGFSPVLGEKICINSMPETLREQLKRNPEMLGRMKESISAQTTSEHVKFWSFPQFNGYLRESSGGEITECDPYDIDFPDPQEYLIGFKICSHLPPNPRKKISTLINVTAQQPTMKSGASSPTSRNSTTIPHKSPVPIPFLTMELISPERDNQSLTAISSSTTPRKPFRMGKEMNSSKSKISEDGGSSRRDKEYNKEYNKELNKERKGRGIINVINRGKRKTGEKRKESSPPMKTTWGRSNTSVTSNTETPVAKRKESKIVIPKRVKKRGPEGGVVVVNVGNVISDNVGTKLRDGSNKVRGPGGGGGPRANSVKPRGNSGADIEVLDGVAGVDISRINGGRSSDRTPHPPHLGCFESPPQPTEIDDQELPQEVSFRATHIPAMGIGIQISNIGNIDNIDNIDNIENIDNIDNIENIENIENPPPHEISPNTTTHIEEPRAAGSGSESAENLKKYSLPTPNQNPSFSHFERFSNLTFGDSGSPRKSSYDEEIIENISTISEEFLEEEIPTTKTESADQLSVPEAAGTKNFLLLNKQKIQQMSKDKAKKVAKEQELPIPESADYITQNLFQLTTPRDKSYDSVTKGNLNIMDKNKKRVSMISSKIPSLRTTHSKSTKGESEGNNFSFHKSKTIIEKRENMLIMTGSVVNQGRKTQKVEKKNIKEGAEVTKHIIKKGCTTPTNAKSRDALSKITQKSIKLNKTIQSKEDIKLFDEEVKESNANPLNNYKKLSQKGKQEDFFTKMLDTLKPASSSGTTNTKAIRKNNLYFEKGTAGAGIREGRKSLMGDEKIGSKSFIYARYNTITHGKDGTESKTAKHRKTNYSIAN